MPPEIPRRAREITPQWLTSVLDYIGMEAPPIADVDVSSVGEGAGFAGRALRLSVSYEGPAVEAPTSLIAKMTSGDPKVRELMAQLRGYELEARFYESLAATNPTPVPGCYWSGMDLETGDFFLLLEDLAGYATGEQVGDEPQLALVEEVVRLAARLHARWWNAPKLQALDWVSRPGGQRARALRPILVDGVTPFREQFAGTWPKDLLDQLSIAMNRYPDIELAAAAGIETLAHGDYRLDNVMYRWSNIDRPVVVIDWQLLSRGAGLFDIAYLFAQSLPTAFRRAHEQALLALYLSELRAAGVTTLDEGGLQRGYTLGLVLAMRVPLFGSRSDRDGRELIASMPSGSRRTSFERGYAASAKFFEAITERQLAALLDHDALPLTLEMLS
jgi:hypothetical protein